MANRDYFLTTKRVGFSRWEIDDIALAYSLWGEPDVTKYICATGVFTTKQIEERLQTEIDNYKKYRVQYYPFFSLESSELIGCCGLRPYKNETDVYELGFHLRKEFWHNGYAFEAATAMIDYAFQMLLASELKAGHNPQNTSSKKVLEKLGFTYECDEFYAPTGLYHPLYSLKR